MSVRRERSSFLLKRLENFLKLFLKNGRGFIGLVIIVFFVIMALGAQWFTPYNQLGTYANKAVPISGSMAAPSWLQSLPPYLGGNPNLSENIITANDPVFANEEWKWPQGDWNVSIPDSMTSTINFQRDTMSGYSRPDVGAGFPADNVNGSMLMRFVRNGSQPIGNASVLFYKDFYYPYLGVENNGVASLNLIVNGSTHNEVKQLYNKTSSNYYYASTPVPDVVIKISLFIVNPIGQKFVLWPKEPGIIFDSNLSAANLNIWSEDVNEGVEVYRIIKGKGTYRFGLEFQFSDFYYNSSRNADFSARFDNLQLVLLGSGWGILGTNNRGYDLWAELVYGSRVSLYVGVVTALFSVGIGLIIGLASGYLGRGIDEIMMRVSDVIIVLPVLPLLIVLFAVLGASIENLILLLTLLGWPGFARLVRSQVLSLRERSYIEAAKAAGAGSGHILIRHIMPNVMGLVYVTLATTVPGAIVTEAALSFLGFFDPFRMSWGRMLQEMQRANAVDKWWWVLPPGLCIAAISIAFVLLGYALDEVLNPRLRQRR